MRHQVIKAARKAKGITQQELADHMHKSLSTVKAWERPLPQGNEPSNMRDVARLLKFLDIRADIYIFGAPSDLPLDPDQLNHLQLLEKLTPKQQKILMQLMESMLEP